MPQDEEMGVVINPDRCYTKSEYARKINCSPTWVNDLIRDNKVTEIKINGGSFVYDLSNPINEQ